MSFVYALSSIYFRNYQTVCSKFVQNSTFWPYFLGNKCIIIAKICQEMTIRYRLYRIVYTYIVDVTYQSYQDFYRKQECPKHLHTYILALWTKLDISDESESFLSRIRSKCTLLELISFIHISRKEFELFVCVFK